MSSSANVMNTAKRPMYEWKDLPWHKLERQVFKLQKRIFRASQKGDVKRVHRLQRLLLSSWAAKCIAVRRVTQDNQGKKTAGVDGVKSLNPKARMTLVKNLKLRNKPSPVRRIWIDKPGRAEKRPLGIPTIEDRARQYLVKQVLEPEWEARFEPNSYGFRPGRSPHDAIEAIFIQINRAPKWVLEMDIAKCFDRIDQQALLTKLSNTPTLKRQVKAWLKAGVRDGRQLHQSEQGTQQGSPLSPLLANVALHGIEEAVKRYAETLPGGKRDNRVAMGVIRYADDLVILHPSREVIQHCQEISQRWLSQMGLELNPLKTKIVHTLEHGFDFLGFNIRQHKVGKHQSGRKANGQRLGFKTIITPSKLSIKRHLRQVAQTIDQHKAAPQEALISRLNPIIRGWSDYYKTVSSKKIYSSCDNQIWHKLGAWGVRRHANKPRSWVANKYWLTNGRWTFAKGKITLRQHRQTKIKRHVKVKGSSSLYDGDLVYWSTRRGRHPLMPKRKATLLKRQRGRCARCGLFFKDEDLLEVDHIIPKAKGGKDAYTNWQILHRHCHDNKHAHGVRLV